MSDLGKRLGRRIYEFRKQGKLTQAALAEKAKISNEFMSAVERGAKLPSLPVLERIASGLRVEIKDLLNFDRTAFHKLDRMPRVALDVASTIQALKVDDRRRILRIIKILTEPKSR